ARLCREERNLYVSLSFCLTFQSGKTFTLPRAQYSNTSLTVISWDLSTNLHSLEAIEGTSMIGLKIATLPRTRRERPSSHPSAKISVTDRL
ncbi:MAG: hypothetical protein L0229_27525, partial [Blastocatellia bacterium]|nr:hypothetical protein [Blastocatellia bacterium]